MMELSNTTNIILEVLSEKALTARDLFYRLRGMGLPTGLAAVYSLLDELVKQKQLAKSEQNDKIYYLLHAEPTEDSLDITLHCSCCGGEAAIDGAALLELLADKMKFSATSAQAMIYGTCQACQQSVTAPAAV